MSEDVTRSCRDLNKLSEKGKVAFTLFLDECKKRGLNVLVTETYRSQGRQEYLYSQGRTRPGKIVTYVRTTGYHGKGLAIDICKNVKGHEYDDPNFFKQCYQVAKELGIEWGGTCFGSFKDTPHFQIESTWEMPKAKLATTKVDEDLAKAVSKIIRTGVQIDFNSWKRLDLINEKNICPLIDKLGGLDNIAARIKAKGMAFDTETWKGVIAKGTASKVNIRALIIKFAATI